MQHGGGRRLVNCAKKPSVDALAVRDLYPDLFTVRRQSPIRARNVRFRMIGRHEFKASHNEEKNYDYNWQIDQHAKPSGKPGRFFRFGEVGFHDSKSAMLLLHDSSGAALLSTEIYHRVNSDPGD